jgi:MYXO-CTERM domain-containing protein
MPNWVRLFFVLLLLFVSATAAGADEHQQLMQQIQRDYDALGTNDCTVACKAFSSMRRATDRLCEIDPGSACAEAKSKLEDARRRVRASCPMCAVDEEPKPKTEAPPPPAPPPARAEAVTASAPPAESKRGGCAGCRIGGVDPGGEILFILALAAAFLRRRR